MYILSSNPLSDIMDSYRSPFLETAQDGFLDLHSRGDNQGNFLNFKSLSQMQKFKYWKGPTLSGPNTRLDGFGDFHGDWLDDFTGTNLANIIIGIVVYI